MTDSKRTIHVAPLALVGRRKSLRYQPTAPAKDSGELSPAFQAFGTLTAFHPALPVSSWGPELRLSNLNSHWPSMRKRPVGPVL